MIEGGPIPPNCGACGVDLSKVWHASDCPALRSDWKVTCDAAFKAQNGAASLLNGIEPCLQLSEAVPVLAELQKLKEWATLVEREASESLRRHFPFSKRDA